MTNNWEQRFDTFIDTLPTKEFIRTEIEIARQEERKRIVKMIEGLKYRVDNAIMTPEREAENRMKNKIISRIKNNSNEP